MIVGVNNFLMLLMFVPYVVQINMSAYVYDLDIIHGQISNSYSLPVFYIPILYICYEIIFTTIIKERVAVQVNWSLKVVNNDILYSFL